MRSDHRKGMIGIGVFFWLIGSVCVGPALGAEQAAQSNETAPTGVFKQADPGQMQSAAPSAKESAADPTPSSATKPQPQGQQTADAQTSGSNNTSADASNTSGETASDGESSTTSASPQPQAGGSAPGQQKPDLPKGQGVNVGSFGKIDLHVKELKLTKVLQLLSIQAKKNIIASKNVAGAVSADLYNVDFYEALDAILHPNGYGYRKKGNFIYVYTAEELKKIKKQNREKVHRIIQLNYLNAADATSFVKPMLSPDGSISVSSQVDQGFKPTVSDGGANSMAHSDKLVVFDYAKNVKEIAKVVDKLDTRPKQVLIEATILQARLQESNAFGVDFSIFSDLDPGQLSSPLAAVDDLISGEGAQGSINQGSAIGTSAGNTAAGDSSVKIGTLGNDASVFVRALDSVTDTNVLATPKVLVLNRQKADLQVGQRLGYLSTTQTETANTQTVEFLDVGTQLTLRPFVSNDGFVRMELKPSVSDGNTNRVVQGKVIPQETTQEMTTNVLVESGQTVVLGGLFKEDTGVSRNQVPGLGEIPGLGAAFQGQDDTVSRSEVIFLIKPTVVKDKALAKAGDRMKRDVEDARLGARDGLLPWSRTKLTSSHMKQALDHKRAGETDKALWDVNLALYLDPTMVDAIQLKEKLTGEKMEFHDRSRLNDVVNTMVESQLKQNGQSDAGQNEAAGSKATQTEPAGSDEMPDKSTGQKADATPKDNAEPASKAKADDSAPEKANVKSNGQGSNITTVGHSANESETDNTSRGDSAGEKAATSTTSTPSIDAKTADDAASSDESSDGAAPNASATENESASDNSPADVTEPGAGDDTDASTSGDTTQEAIPGDGDSTSIEPLPGDDGTASDSKSSADADSDAGAEEAETEGTPWETAK
jgi:type IV pilus assembly protein PilQ